MSEHNHTQLETQRLTNALQDMINQQQRRLDTYQDVIRALQYLVDAIHVSHQAQPPAEGTILAEAFSNAQAALRAFYQPNGR